MINLQRLEYYENENDKPLPVDESGLCGFWATSHSKHTHWQSDQTVKLYTARPEGADSRSSAEIVSNERDIRFLKYLLNDLNESPEGLEVLDCGGGDGRLGRLLTLLGARATVLDPSAKQLDLCHEAISGPDHLRHRIHETECLLDHFTERPFLAANTLKLDLTQFRNRIRTMLGGGEQLGALRSQFGPQHFDLITDKFASQWGNRAQILKEYAAALKPGGRAVLMTTVPAPGNHPNLFLEAHNQYIAQRVSQGTRYKHAEGRPTHPNVITHTETLKQYAKTIGLEPEAHFEYSEQTARTPEDYVRFLEGVIGPQMTEYLEEEDSETTVSIKAYREAILKNMHTLSAARNEEPVTEEQIAVISLKKA